MGWSEEEALRALPTTLDDDALEVFRAVPEERRAMLQEANGEMAAVFDPPSSSVPAAERDGAGFSGDGENASVGAIDGGRVANCGGGGADLPVGGPMPAGNEGMNRRPRMVAWSGDPMLGGASTARSAGSAATSMVEDPELREEVTAAVHGWPNAGERLRDGLKDGDQGGR
ncbi:unnamed protein product [Lampetra planeri]